MKYKRIILKLGGETLAFKGINFNSVFSIINKKLNVMDLSAITLCMNNNIPILAFNINKKGNLRKI